MPFIKFYNTIYIILLLLVLYSNNIHANEKQNCWVIAGSKYNIEPWLLYSIAQVESSLDPNAINYNKTSVDLGLMQINSWWIDKLKKYGIDRKALYNSCVNIHVGAWILHQSIQRFDSFWEGVGAYNAGTANTKKARLRRSIYAEKVYKKYNKNINSLK